MTFAMSTMGCIAAIVVRSADVSYGSSADSRTVDPRCPFRCRKQALVGMEPTHSCQPMQCFWRMIAMGAIVARGESART